MNKITTLCQAVASNTYFSARMNRSSQPGKRHSLPIAFSLVLTLLLSLVRVGDVWGQVNYTQNWSTSGLNGWTSQHGNFSQTTTAVCASSGSVRANFSSSNVLGNFASPSLTNNNGLLVTMSYQYKIVNNSNGSPGSATPNNFGSLRVQYAPSLNGPWADVPGSIIANGGTVTTTFGQSGSINHSASTSCATRTVTFTPPSGGLFVRFKVFFGTGNYYLYVDEVSISQTALSQCSGTPSVGQTVVWSPALVTGFNTDVIANGIGAASSSASQFDFDAYGLVSADFQQTSSSALPTYSLPLNGIVNSAANSGIRYQLGSYSSNNSLRLVGQNTNGTLTLQSGTTAKSVALLVSSGSGSSTFSAQVNFTDGTNQQFTGNNVSDWYGSGYAIGGIGRVLLSNGALEGSPTQPGMYDVVFTLNTANQAKIISSVLITKTDASSMSSLNVFGISLRTNTPTAVVCYGQTITLSLPNLNTSVPGLTYQWQSSGSLSGPWSNIVGATATTYTTPALTSAGVVYYQCVVTCSNSSSSATSTPLALTVNPSLSISPSSGAVYSGSLLQALPSTGSTYLWSTNETTSSIAVTTAGTYSVLISNNGCVDQPSATVTINCSGTPNNGVAAISTASGCPNASFILSATNFTFGPGISYQWQSAPSATGPWTNVAGATSTTLTTSTATSTFYRLNTTCLFSVTSSQSNAVSYTAIGGSCQCGTYPAVYASSTADEEISNVTVGTMNNSSNCSTTAPGPGSLNRRYSNYSGSVVGPSVNQGDVVNFSVTQTSCGGAYTNIFQIFVDFNQDGDFLDAGEFVYNQPVATSGNHTKTGSFVVPAGATLGTTRMRVVNVESGATTTNYAHTGYTWGETEDYCFTVTLPPPCAGTPTPGNTIASPNSVFAGQTTTLTLQNVTAGTGVTYQWQSAPSATGPWTNITGA
ncbi:MAG: hypothetical protein FJ349_09615, partial [Sphingomonadales bacterium]|nr:hypothetical protein [Sphingomonadales bacterium]